MKEIIVNHSGREIRQVSLVSDGNTVKSNSVSDGRIVEGCDDNPCEGMKSFCCHIQRSTIVCDVDYIADEIYFLISADIDRRNDDVE